MMDVDRKVRMFVMDVRNIDIFVFFKYLVVWFLKNKRWRY